MVQSLFKTVVIGFALVFSLSAYAHGKKRAIASDELIDSVTCRLRHDPVHYIRAESLKGVLPLKVSIHLSGPVQNGYHGQYALLKISEARGQKDILDSAKKESIDLAKADQVAVFSLNGGFSIYKFISKKKTIGTVLSVLGSTYLCAEPAANP